MLFVVLIFITSCENLPWDKKEDEEYKEKKLFTEVAPAPGTSETIEDETVSSLPVPDVNTDDIKKKFPPSKLTPPTVPPKPPPFYEKFLTGFSSNGNIKSLNITLTPFIKYLDGR